MEFCLFGDKPLSKAMIEKVFEYTYTNFIDILIN